MSGTEKMNIVKLSYNVLTQAKLLPDCFTV